MTELKPMTRKAAGTQHPMAFPILRCRPERVSGMPIWRDNFDFAAEMPVARFHENDNPGIPFFLAIIFPPQL